MPQKASAAPAIAEVQMLANGIQYSIHECPKKHMRELQTVFKGLDISDLLVVPTCQRSDLDLVRVGDIVEDEKDRLLEKFVDFAKSVCAVLAGRGYWADYIDPCSGLPMIHREYHNVYSEVDALSTLLGYKTSNAGCCKIILHPEWGTSVYPASLFAKAPPEALQAAIQHAAVASGQKHPIGCACCGSAGLPRHAVNTRYD